jgi:RNA polymerase-binding protein DksA
MKNERLDFYRTLLMERREFALETIERLRAFSPIQEEDLELTKTYSDDFADQGSESIGKEESFLLLSRELRYLNRIENALKSIELGIYGKCKYCGQMIPHERLMAVPTTDTCIKCKKSIVSQRH